MAIVWYLTLLTVFVICQICALFVALYVIKYSSCTIKLNMTLTVVVIFLVISLHGYKKGRFYFPFLSCFISPPLYSSLSISLSPSLSVFLSFCLSLYLSLSLSVSLLDMCIHSISSIKIHF